MTEFNYHGVIFRAPVYMTSGGPGLEPHLTIGETIEIVEIESLETWLDFSKLMPDDYLQKAADDPQFVESAIEAAEYDRDPY